MNNVQKYSLKSRLPHINIKGKPNFLTMLLIICFIFLFSFSCLKLARHNFLHSNTCRYSGF